MKTGRVVIALGGNALGDNVDEQKEAARGIAKVIVDLAQQGMDIVITHGNGPQVGMIQNAMDKLSGTEETPAVPLPTSVAMSQGYIGIDLQNAVKYELYRRGIDKKVSTILSQVEVAADDPEFRTPTKPIGRFMSKEEAEEKEKHGIRCMEDAGRGYRVVVPSPMPRTIRELETIRTLLEAGHIVIACGGGGIPVIRRDGELVGVDAVIDKDRVSSLLARCLGADYLVILTAVERVAINYGRADQQWISDMTVEEARDYIAQGQFAKGSMLPKIESAVEFADFGRDKTALITLLDKAADGIAGRTGTRIHR
jgi:carbamate kinase